MAKKKKMSSFWKAYIAIAVLLFVALGVWLLILNNWLSDFEAVQPKYVAEETYEKYFKNFNALEYVKLCAENSDFVETEENVAAYLKGITDGKEISIKKVSSGMDKSIKYLAIAGSGEDEVKFASFVLTEKEGTKGYEAGQFQVYTDSNHKVTVEAPKGYKVFVNGGELSEDLIVENDIATESCQHMPEGVSGLYYTRYTVKGLLSEPTVKVTDADGTETAVEKTESAYVAKPVYDTALADEYTDWILEGVEKYAKYSQYDWRVSATGFGQVAPFFDPSAPLYESIRTVENMFVIEYDKYEFVDMTASEFVRYDDNTFSCRVQYTQNLYKGADLYDDFVDQTLYLRRVEDKFLIYDMNVN